jgi:hypothetical protein
MTPPFAGTDSAGEQNWARHTVNSSCLRQMLPFTVVEVAAPEAR